MELHTIGIDLGKTSFHLVGLNPRGEVIVRKKFSRAQLLRFTANRQVHLIGMEACGGAHFLGRALREQGHEVRLIPAQYVKPFVKTNESDFKDAEAIAEAVDRPSKKWPLQYSGESRTARHRPVSPRQMLRWPYNSPRESCSLRETELNEEISACSSPQEPCKLRELDLKKGDFG